MPLKRPARRLRVGVVGAGFGGSAAALHLARQGHVVTVLEAVPDPAPVGAGILLSPTALYALAELGLAESVLSRGARIERLRCVNVRGKTIFDLPYAARDARLFGLGLHRGVLFETLFGAVRAAGVDVKLGVTAAALDPTDPRVVVDTERRLHGPFDLVVVADGARSRIRRATLPHARDEEYPWGAFWFVAPDPDERFARELLQRVDGTRHMVGLLPTGRAPSGRGPNETSLFASVRLDEVDAIRARGLDAWKESVLRVAPMAESVLAHVRSMDELLVASYRHVHLARANLGPVVFVGDAAHAMSPQLGQGSNLALYDAKVLAACIAGDTDVERALVRFDAERRHHVGFYRFMTRLLTPVFQSDLALLGRVRDALLGSVSRLGYVRHRMIGTLAGVERGIVRAPIALPSEPLALPTRARESEPASATLESS